MSAKLKMIINAKCILALAQLFPRNEFEASTFIWEIKDHPIDLDIQLNFKNNRNNTNNLPY